MQEPQPLFYTAEDEHYFPREDRYVQYAPSMYDRFHPNTYQPTGEEAMLDYLPSEVINGLDGLALDQNLAHVYDRQPSNTPLPGPASGYLTYQAQPANPQFQYPYPNSHPQVNPTVSHHGPQLSLPYHSVSPANLMSARSTVSSSSTPKSSASSEKEATYRCTWSQTRRVRNLNRPMIPVSIKIPLHEKHLWWESPTITLNMFAPYSTQLVRGEKTVETRNYQLPNKCKGVRIGIVEIMPKGLPSKKPELVGEVVFVDCKEYLSREQWEADAPQHQIDVNDERFGWKKNRKKFGWVVHTWQPYDRAIREAASDYCNTRIHYTKNFFVWAYV